MTRYTTLAELKAALDSGQIDRSKVTVVVDSDSVSASIYGLDFQRLWEAEPREALHEALSLLGLTSEDA